MAAAAGATGLGVEYRFPIVSGRYSSNQTVCVGMEDSNSDERVMRWSEELCQTEVRERTREIVCTCN